MLIIINKHHNSISSNNHTHSLRLGSAMVVEDGSGGNGSSSCSCSSEGELSSKQVVSWQVVTRVWSTHGVISDQCSPLSPLLSPWRSPKMNRTDEPHYYSIIEISCGGWWWLWWWTFANEHNSLLFFFFFFFSQQQQQHNMNMNNGLLVISGKWRAQMARHRHKVNFNINRRAYTKEEEEEEDSQEERSTCKCRSKRELHSLLSFTTTATTIIRQQSSSSAIDHWARRKCARRSELVVSWREGSKVTENTVRRMIRTSRSRTHYEQNWLTDWLGDQVRGSTQHTSIARPHICRAHLSQQQQQQQ